MPTASPERSPPPVWSWSTPTTMSSACTPTRPKRSPISWATTWTDEASVADLAPALQAFGHRAHQVAVEELAAGAVALLGTTPALRDPGRLGRVDHDGVDLDLDDAV